MLQFTCACIKDAPIAKNIPSQKEILFKKKKSQKEMAVAALVKKKAAAKQESRGSRIRTTYSFISIHSTRPRH
jgi:aspartate oxidase